MEYIDLRKVGREGLKEIRRQVIRLKKLGKKGHDLAYLFQLLPQTQKNILTASIKKDCNLNDAIFQDGLNSIADTFNKQRYQFSNYNQDLSTHIMFAPFVHTMCKFVLEI